jgi:hypothetical protein
MQENVDATKSDKPMSSTAATAKVMLHAEQFYWDSSGNFSSGSELTANQERGTWYQGQQDGELPAYYHNGIGGVEGDFLPGTSSRPYRTQVFPKLRTFGTRAHGARAGEHNVSRAGRRVVNNIKTSIPDRNSAEAMALSVRKMGALLPAPQDRMNPPQRAYNTAAFGGQIPSHDLQILELRKAVADLQHLMHKGLTEGGDQAGREGVADDVRKDARMDAECKTNIYADDHSEKIAEKQCDDPEYYLGKGRFRGPMGASAMQRSVSDLQVLMLKACALCIS